MLFSVVVPVYNVEKYLDECLKSLINQYKENFTDKYEIILIDDGSTDKSGEICEIYQKEYSDLVRVYHNENQGLLLTRRFGYKKAKGDYIVNCDSDDFLEEGALKELENIILKYNYPDIVFFNHYVYNGKEKNVEYSNIFTNDQDIWVSKEDVFSEFMLGHSVVSVCGKICKRSCVDIYKDYTNFGKFGNGEDTLQSIEFFRNANKFVYLNSFLYNYRIGSGMTCKFDVNYFFSFTVILELIRQQKEDWEVTDFEHLFAVKVLQTAGRAITQSRYKRWTTLKENKLYLKKIKDDKIFKENIDYLKRVKSNIQVSHYILLWMMKRDLLYTICVLLMLKNKFD